MGLDGIDDGGVSLKAQICMQLNKKEGPRLSLANGIQPVCRQIESRCDTSWELLRCAVLNDVPLSWLWMDLVAKSLDGAQAQRDQGVNAALLGASKWRCEDVLAWKAKKVPLRSNQLRVIQLLVREVSSFRFGGYPGDLPKSDAVVDLLAV